MDNSEAKTPHVSFLQAQTNKYQGYTQRLTEHWNTNGLSIVIKPSQNSINQKTYDSTLSQEFNQEYSTLFFQQLDQVITSSTIKVELTECTLRSIVTHTEQYLSGLVLPPQEIHLLHDKFLSDCQN